MIWYFTSDSKDPDFEIKVVEHWYDGAKNGTGTRPSVAAIESHLESLGVSFQRFDDEDLNAHYLGYNWKEGVCDGKTRDGLRRFWYAEC